MLYRIGSLTDVIMQKMMSEINAFSSFGAEGLVKHEKYRLIVPVDGEGAFRRES